MTDAFVITYINKKISEAEDENYIRYSYYELKIKNNLNDEEISKFLAINKNYFENKGYNVYFTGANFTYKNMRMKVQDNEFMIAVKEVE